VSNVRYMSDKAPFGWRQPVFLILEVKTDRMIELADGQYSSWPWVASSLLMYGV
jgi:hypothetical protein